ncbi:MAG: PPOX class F420-dependent oxidoreductase [Ferrimicrobium sp.]|jgi:PPOX class probable F420-dependent enzyme|nr:PPOX class F420-dependent oxidoreductase [Ferrimicrobium sp.]
MPKHHPSLDFLDTNHRAVLTTLRRDGSVQLSPVLAVRLGPQSIGISSRETAMKTKNLRNNPQAFLCVFPDAFFGEWIQVDGTTQIHSLPKAMERLVDYYRRANGEHNDWDAYRQAMVQERRVLLEITVTRIGPTISG